MRNLRLGLLSSLVNNNISIISRQCVRSLHKNVAKPPVPSPTPFVPDVPTFLSLIGRDMSKHASKFPSWESLFTLSSPELREQGIEPARQRRYLLRKRDKFRKGIHGPGGDLVNVVDGVAQLRVVEVPRPQEDKRNISSATLSPGMKRVVVNLPPDATEYKNDRDPSKLRKFAYVRIYNGDKVKGPFLKPLKGSNGSAALIRAQEGMWEDKQGHKVDGGERRRAEIRAKRRSEERKANA